MATGPSVEQLREDYIARLLKRHESRSEALSKVVNGLLLFGLLFFFLILFPFVSLHHQGRRLTSELRSLSDQAKSFDSTLVAYRRAADGIQDLKRAVERGPVELRDAIRGGFAAGSAQDFSQQQNAAQMVQQSAPEETNDATALSPGDCPEPPRSTEWMNCQVRHQVERQFDAYADVLESSVIGPLQRLSSASGAAPIPVPDSSKLRGGLAKMQSAFEARLRQTPRFWERFQGKVDFFDELGEDVDHFWSESGLEAQQNKLDTALQQVQRLQHEREADLKELDQRETALASRLEKMESPFGKLPLGLLEGVHLYPILLTGGFIVCLALLSELVGIRAALYSAYRERDPTGAVFTPTNVALVAPLWIDPLGPAGQRRLRTLMLLAPMLLALLAMALVLYSWSIPGRADAASELERRVYGTLYVICALVGVYGWHRVRVGVRPTAG